MIKRILFCIFWIVWVAPVIICLWLMVLMFLTVVPIKWVIKGGEFDIDLSTWLLEKSMDVPFKIFKYDV